MPDSANPMNYGQPAYPDPNDPAYYDPYAQQAAWNQGQYPQGQPMPSPEGMYDMNAGYMQNMQSPQDIYASQANAVPSGYDAYGNPVYGQGYGDPMAQPMGMDQGGYGYQGGMGDPMQGYGQPMEPDMGQPMQQDPMRGTGSFPAVDPNAQPMMDAQGMPAPGMSGNIGMPIGAQPMAGQPMGAQPEQAVAPQPAPQPAPQEEVHFDPSQATKGKATMCLVFGLLSILFGLIPPIGVIFGLLGYKKAGKYFRAGGTAASADSGRVFSIVGLVFSGLMFLFLIGFISYMVGAMTGNATATNLITFFNQSPLGSIITIPLS